MGRDGAADIELIRATRRKILGQAAQRIERSDMVGPFGLEGAGRSKDDLGRRPVDRQSDAAEAPPQVTVEVEEAEVKAGRRDHAHGRRR